MRDFLVEQSDKLLARPNRFLVPVAQLPDHSCIIPRATSIVIMEHRPGQCDRNRARVWQLGHSLCRAGVPVFSNGEGIRIYCPCTGAPAIFDAFQFHKEAIPSDAQELREHAERDDGDAIARIVGEVSYRLDNNAVIIDGARRQGTIDFRAITRQYSLPEGATLL